MINPLLNVPLNTKNIYVRAITPNGCKIYMPVNSNDDCEQDAAKTKLQIWLNNQCPYYRPEKA